MTGYITKGIGGFYYVKTSEGIVECKPRGLSLIHIYLGVSVLVTQAVDESVAAGSIIRTDPAAGSQVAAGTTVVIYVSRTQVATTTKVPSRIGMNVNDARTPVSYTHLEHDG